MIKNLSKLAVLACAACFALSSQSEAAALSTPGFGKSTPNTNLSTNDSISGGLQKCDSCVKVPVLRTSVEIPVLRTSMEIPVQRSYEEVPVQRSYVKIPVQRSYVKIPVQRSYVQIPVQRSYVKGAVYVSKNNRQSDKSMARL